MNAEAYRLPDGACAEHKSCANSAESVMNLRILVSDIAGKIMVISGY